MSGGQLRQTRLDTLLAALLRYGSWLASIAIAVGLALALLGFPANMRIATAGIIMFILLPALRVLLMLVVFIRERDYSLAIVAAVVLTILALGFAIGLRTSSLPS